MTKISLDYEQEEVDEYLTRWQKKGYSRDDANRREEKLIYKNLFF